MSDSEAMLHEANRRAHAVAKAADWFMQMLDEPTGEWRDIADARDVMREKVVRYREIEQRQIEEATR